MKSKEQTALKMTSRIEIAHSLDHSMNHSVESEQPRTVRK